MEKYMIEMDRIVKKVECIVEDEENFWIKSIYKNKISVQQYSKNNDFVTKFFDTLDEAKKHIIKNYNSKILNLKKEIGIYQNKINQIERIRKI